MSTEGSPRIRSEPEVYAALLDSGLTPLTIRLMTHLFHVQYLEGKHGDIDEQLKIHLEKFRRIQYQKAYNSESYAGYFVSNFRQSLCKKILNLRYSISRICEETERWKIVNYSHLNDDEKKDVVMITSDNLRLIRKRLLESKSLNSSFYYQIVKEDDIISLYQKLNRFDEIQTQGEDTNEEKNK